MAELDDLSITDASNTGRFPENMQFRNVNDAGRALEGMIAREYKDRNMSLTASGSSNAFTVASNRTLTAYSNGLTIGFTANHSITGSATLNVSGLGAKTIRAQDGSAVGSGDIVNGQKVLVAYRSATDDFQMVGGRVSGASADVLARITPVGIVAPWPGATAPSGWLFAYGQAVSRTTYAELFAAYGTTYGTGDGSTTFNLPDYRGRTPFGDDNMGGSTAGRITAAGSGITGTTLGAVGGAETHTLTVAQIPAHPHTGTTDASTVTYTDSIRSGVQTAASGSAFDANIGETTASRSSSPQTHTFTTNNAGGDLAHNNMPPAIIQNWIILALPALASAANLGVNGFLYQFSSSTSGDPGTGKLGFNHATIASSTGFRISETDAAGSPMAAVLATLDDSTSTVKGTLYVYKVGQLSTYAVVQITGTITDSGGYDGFSHTYVSNNGTFTDSDQLSVIFVAKGDAGDPGAGIDWQGAWVTATAYALADGVSRNGSSYICTSGHTSGAGTEPGVGASWATVWDVIAAKGASGSGSGDMLAANNLTDVANAATAFANIKQSASETATGVVELATDAETVTGTSTVLATHPSGVKAAIDAAALAFKTISVSGQSDVVADSRTDTLTLVGVNIAITTNASTDTITFTGSGSVPYNFLTGLTLSRNSGTPTTKIDMAIGQAADSTNTLLITTSGTLTADCTTVGANGLDAGSLANNTWYHVYLIALAAGATPAILLSTSASAPTLPGSYIYKRRVGSVRTNGSAQFIAFTNDGDYFLWSTALFDVNTTNPGTAAVTSTLTVPTGVNVQALINAHLTASGTSARVIVSDLAFTDVAPSSGAAAPGATTGGNASQDGRVAHIKVRTNTSAQVRYRCDSSDASTTMRIITLGWWDYRGR
jgi:microcystin-dependent protein